MSEQQAQLVDQITSLHLQLSDKIMQYWTKYSDWTTWQFWFVVMLFVAPLIVLYWKLDWKKALEYGFFGFGVHTFFGYIDAFGVLNGYWKYPYIMFPYLPSNLSLEASFIPVTYMLVYQWTKKTNRNCYLYFFLLAFGLAFVLKPLLVFMGLFQLDRGTTYLHLALGYIAIFLFAKGTTALFLYMQQRAKGAWAQ